ncbi:MAG: PAS-domain containing protein [Paracoccaceae bacterium]
MPRSNAASSNDSKALQEMFEDCMMSHPDGIAVLDDAGTFIFSNTRYNEMFFDKDKIPIPGESALQVVRRIIDGNRVVGLDQMDPDHAALNMVIDCFSFVQGAEFSLKNGRVIQVNSSPTKDGRILMSFRDTRRDRLGERRAAELLSEGLGSADMGMVLWDASLNVQMVNPAWQDITLPLTIGDEMTRFFQTLVDSDMLPVPVGMTKANFVHETVAAAHAKPMRLLLSLPDGRHIQISTFGITSGGVLATAVDISQQYNAEERARALLRDAVEALEIGVLHFDENLTLLMVNRAAKKMVWADMPDPDESTKLNDIIEALIDKGTILIPRDRTGKEVVQSFEDAARNFEKQRRVTWENGRTFEFSTEPTEMGGYLVSVQDLTDSVRAEREVREAHELVTTIVDASPTTFLVSKVDTAEVVYATDASRERFGDIKSTLSFFLDPQHRKTYLDALLPTGELNDYPVRFRRSDGSIMDGLTSARVIDYRGEKMIVSSTRDITEFLEMQRELETQRRHALQNEKLSALGELLAGVAHELSNPLSVVVGYAMMLRDEVSEKPFIEKIDRIALSADRCVRIVKMFLALAREKPAEPQVCKIENLLESAIALSSGGIETVGGHIELHCASNMPSVTADPDHVTQVFTNLIVNATHAVADLGAKAHVHIQAYCEPDGRSIAIDVEDNGPGVPKDIQQRIFDPFFTTKEVGSGTGFGLAFSHRVVSAHKGTLTLEAPTNGGALFRVRLPVSECATEVQPIKARAVANNDLSLPILLLDDDDSVAGVLAEILADAGYSVDVVHAAKDALAWCDQRAYSCILTDIRMPDMDGRAFYAALQDKHANHVDRVIFLTGDTLNPDIAQFLEETGCICLEKPILPNDLLAQVRRLTTRGPQ